MTHEERQAAMKKFLVGLEKLTRETGIEIAGCGCDGSPFLSELELDVEGEGGYCTSLDGDYVSWKKDAGSDHEELHSKTEQDSNDDI